MTQSKEGNLIERAIEYAEAQLNAEYERRNICEPTTFVGVDGVESYTEKAQDIFNEHYAYFMDNPPPPKTKIITVNLSVPNYITSETVNEILNELEDVEVVSVII